MKTETFEDYLQEKHSEQYVGLDDDMVDDCGDWIADLDVDELIGYAELYGMGRFNAGLKEAQRMIDEAFGR